VSYGIIASGHIEEEIAIGIENGRLEKPTARVLSIDQSSCHRGHSIIGASFCKVHLTKCGANEGPRGLVTEIFQSIVRCIQQLGCADELTSPEVDNAKQIERPGFRKDVARLQGEPEPFL